jgi:hypothetical protein
MAQYPASHSSHSWLFFGTTATKISLYLKGLGVQSSENITFRWPSLTPSSGNTRLEKNYSKIKYAEFATTGITQLLE